MPRFGKGGDHMTGQSRKTELEAMADEIRSIELEMMRRIVLCQRLAQKMLFGWFFVI